VTETRRYPLGRLVQHDPRSIGYAVPALPHAAMQSRRWERKIPILDQGSLGSCTGNAGTSLLGTEPYASQLPGDLLSKLDEGFAVELYSAATRVDPFPGDYPPDDTGSSGLAVAKVLRQRGLTSSYRHAFGLRAAMSALQTGPVLIGIPWYESMFNPGADGRVSIDGDEVGGHELCVEGVDVDQREVLVANSWGAGWGDHGYLRLRLEQLRYLLRRQGDCTVPARPQP
jgi:hypothetical protein